MKINKLKSVALAATTIAVAMTVGLAVPASANGVLTLTSSAPSISRGETITIASNGTNETAVLFINGESMGGNTTVGLMVIGAAPWEAFSPCVTIDVTFRVYSETYDANAPAKDFADPFEAEATVEWIGDNTVDCDDTWGAGARAPEDSDEPLAKTGSDSSALTGLTGLAGVAALAVAVAVARRTRRAQR